MKSFLIALCAVGMSSSALAQNQPAVLTKYTIAQSVGLPPSTSWEELELAFNRKIEREGCAQLDIEAWKCSTEYIWAPILDERRLNQISYQTVGMRPDQAETHLSAQLKLTIAELRDLQALKKRRDQAMRHVSLAREQFRQARERESQP